MKKVTFLTLGDNGQITESYKTTKCRVLGTVTKKFIEGYTQKGNRF